MNRRGFMRLTGLGMMAAGMPLVVRAEDPGTQKGAPVRGAKPNIVIILADDLGYGDVQCYNPQRGKIPTPYIDRLAAQGLRFTDGHCSSGVCSPSRYTLLTGRYHWRSRLQTGIVPEFGKPLIAPDRLTIGGLAKQHGYRTAAIGKWHLGWDWPITPEQHKILFGQGKAAVTADLRQAACRDVFSKRIAGGPTERGFDEYFGTDVPNWPPFCFIENNRTVGIPDEPGMKVKGWTFEPILPALGERAAQFITAQSKQGAPFLLYLPLTSPHEPIAPTPEWRGKSGINPYADFVMETDAVVGRVLDALEASGVASNTLVVFTSDNGCSPVANLLALEQHGHFASGPLRGHKSDAWEGGHRIPFIARWPQVVKPGRVCDQLVQQADFMATIADILGTKLPDNAGEDSFSLLPLLQGEDKPVRTTAVNCSINGVPAVRYDSWKLILAPGSGGWSTGDTGQTVQLYDLAADLGETNNLAAAHPERVAQMKAMIEKLITDGRSTPGQPQKNDVEVKRFSSKPARPTPAKPQAGEAGRPAGGKAAEKAAGSAQADD